jgi:hypothetical protein
LSGADGGEIERLDEAGCRCASVTFDQLVPAPWQEGKDIVVLDRWAEDRAEGAVSSLARSRPVSEL